MGRNEMLVPLVADYPVFTQSFTGQGCIHSTEERWNYPSLFSLSHPLRLNIATLPPHSPTHIAFYIIFMISCKEEPTGYDYL